MVNSLKDALGLKKDFSEHINKQMEIGGDFTILKHQGFVRNLVVTPRDDKDDMYKFQIRFIDESDRMQNPDEWYSGFKEFPALEGDYIIFTWKKNGIWNNVKEILDVKSTHEKPQEEDNKNLKRVQLDIKEPKVTSNLEGDSATVSNVLPTTGLSEPHRALLLNGTIHLCTKRGNLTHDEIVAQYNRFLKILND